MEDFLFSTSRWQEILKIKPISISGTKVLLLQGITTVKYILLLCFWKFILCFSEKWTETQDVIKTWSATSIKKKRLSFYVIFNIPVLVGLYMMCMAFSLMATAHTLKQDFWNHLDLLIYFTQVYCWQVVYSGNCFIW